MSTPVCMSLTAFLKKHHLPLKKSTLAACRLALKIMTKSRDNMHDRKHVESILDSLDKFITGSREIDWKKINFDVLLLSICWHDVWKSARLPSNRGKAVFHQMAEGIGSMRLFSKLTRNLNLNPQTVKMVRYAVRKHSLVQVLPTKNTEARILQDLDKLDVWKPWRLRRGFASLRNSGSVTPRLAGIFRLFFKYRMLPQSYKANFKWTVSQIQAGKHEFLLEAKNIISEVSGPRSAHDFFQLGLKPHTPFLHRLRSVLAKVGC